MKSTTNQLQPYSALINIAGNPAEGIEMTTPNIEELIDRNNHQRIACNPKPDVFLALDNITALQSQAERIKELESECEVERLRLAACGVAALGYFDGCKDEYKSASLDDVLRLNKRCTDLRAELGDLPEAQAEMLTEIKQLRAEIAAIAAAEPSMIYHGRCVIDCGDSGHHDVTMLKMIARETKLFTRPMPAQGVDARMIKLPEPDDTYCGVNYYTESQLKQAVRDAQDVTELVDALEMIVSTHQGHCEHHVGVSKHSYNLADIAEEALSKYKGAK